MKSPLVYNEIRVARSLVFCVVFCRVLFVLLYFFLWPLYCLFFFDLRFLVTSLWYLQTLLVLLYFFIWPLYCLFFFDLRFLITNCSYHLQVTNICLYRNKSTIPFSLHSQDAYFDEKYIVNSIHAYKEFQNINIFFINYI